MKKNRIVLIYPLLLLGLLFVFASSCEMEEDIDADLQVLTTNEVADITQNTATSGGNITSDGGDTIKARGVCWSTGQLATIADNKTIDGAGTGVFSSSLHGLFPNTKYYVRAYATNSKGTVYGQTRPFTTADVSSVGSFTDPRDGNIYKTVKIGNQVWMGENLKYLPSVTGPSTGSETTPYYYVIGYIGINLNEAKATTNYSTYGVLYNWPAAAGSANSSINFGGVQGVCPAGWHLPGEAEWAYLLDYLGGAGVAGDKLKAAGISLWRSPNTGTNETGFAALPGGFRSTISSWSPNGGAGGFWSATEDNARARYLVVASSYSGASIYDNNKEYGYSVRCLRDETTPPITYNLNLVIEPSGAGIVPGAGQYAENHLLSLIATPNPGWEFVNWTDDEGNEVSNQAGFMYPMPAWNVTLTANFVVSNPTWESCPGIPTVTDNDGNIYNTVLIGNQCWMKENLKTTQYSNGTPIEYPGDDNSVWENNTAGAYAWYANDISWKNIYGALYNWHAVNNTNGLCPAGWHVPTDLQWTQLVDYVEAQGFSNQYYDLNGAGNALKSCRRINSPLGGTCNTTEHPRWEEDTSSGYNLYGFDAYGFSGLPGGNRSNCGYLNEYGHRGFWWTSTEDFTANAWSWRLSQSFATFGHGSIHKGFGYSVRCLKD